MADGAFSRDAFDVDAFDELAFDFGCESFDGDAFDTDAFDTDAFCIVGGTATATGGSKLRHEKFYEVEDSITGVAFDFEADDLEVIMLTIQAIRKFRH